MEINEWISSCKVRAFPWIDGKRIYCNVRYYKPGQSIEREPVWDKTVYITDNEAGRNLVFNFTHSLVAHIIAMQIPDNKEITFTA
jgi:hypothetical protein